MIKILKSAALVSVAASLLLSVAGDGFARNPRGSPVAIVGGNYSQQFSFSSFSSANIGAGSTQLSQTQSSAISGSVIQLTPTTPLHTVGADWYNTLQSIGTFTTTFTFSPTSGTTLAANASSGVMAFVVQNSNTTSNGFYNATNTFVDASGLKAGSDANMGGFGAYSPSIGPNQMAVGNSIAIKFDAFGIGSKYTYTSGGNPSSTGLYINGGDYAYMLPQVDLNPYGINLGNGNTFQGTIVYDGTLLTLVLKDQTTLAQARITWPVNLLNVINTTASSGTTTAYVGFTAGNPPGSSQPQQLKSWTFGTGFNARLTTPTIRYTSPTVSISGPSGASIYYSTNGLPPTTASSLYTGPFTISANTPVQAVAVESGYTDSLVASQNCLYGTTLPINFASFTAGDGIVVSGNGSINGSHQVVLGTSGQAGVAAAWYGLPVPVSSNFTSTANLNLTSATGDGILWVLQNQAQPASNYTTPYVPITSISATGSSVTVNFAPQATAPPVGQTMTVYGVAPFGYNSYAFTATSSTTSSVTYANTTTGTPTALGYIAWDGIGGGSYVSGGPASYADPSGYRRGWGNGSTTFGAGTGQMGGFANSIGLYLDIASNTISYATNGIPLPNAGVSISPVNLSSTTAIVQTITYNSSANTLTVQLTQGASNFTKTYSSVNIPGIVGANTAYAGFIATNGGVTANIFLNSWTMG